MSDNAITEQQVEALAEVLDDVITVNLVRNPNYWRDGMESTARQVLTILSQTGWRFTWDGWTEEAEPTPLPRGQDPKDHNIFEVGMAQIKRARDE